MKERTATIYLAPIPMNPRPRQSSFHFWMSAAAGARVLSEVAILEKQMYEVFEDSRVVCGTAKRVVLDGGWWAQETFVPGFIEEIPSLRAIVDVPPTHLRNASLWPGRLTTRFHCI